MLLILIPLKDEVSGIDEGCYAFKGDGVCIGVAVNGDDGIAIVHFNQKISKGEARASKVNQLLIIRKVRNHILTKLGRIKQKPVKAAIARQDIIARTAVQKVNTAPANQRIIAPAPKELINCLLYTSPSPRDATLSRMPSSA